MGIVTTIGLDIAKSVFQVHGVDEAGDVVVRREADPWARAWILREPAPISRWDRGMQLLALLGAREQFARGHDVRLLPAQYVKPYLKRQ